MGLGLYIEAPNERQRGAMEVAELCRESIEDELLADFASTTSESERAQLTLHPAEESIFFERRDNRILCSAKTSSAGPGYHAYVVELLDRVGREHGLRWKWEFAPDAEVSGDECEFFQRRDFALLQADMARHLRALARYLVDEQVEEASLSLPVGFFPVQPGRLRTPLGPQDLSWAQQIAAADDEELENLASSFFPWWSKGCDAGFWDRYGRALGWLWVPWHAPASDSDAEVCDQTLAALARSRELDPAITLPDIEVAELRRLLSSEVEDWVAPRPHGIGYRRGEMVWSVTAGWSVRAPGYWYDQWDDGSLVLWFADRTIRASSIRVQGRQDRDLLEAATRSQKYESDTDVVTWETDRLFAQGVVKWTEDGSGYWALEGCVASGDSLCVASFCYGDEADRSWAEAAFRQVARQG